MQVCAKHWVYNNKPTVFTYYFFHLLSFVFVDTAQQNYKKLRTKTNKRKRILQKPLGHFSYRNIEHILKNYKYLQSLVSLRLLCGSGGGGTSGAACRVVEFVVCVKMCGVCLWVSARVLSASGDMWRVRSAGASTVSSLEKSERGKNKSSEVPDLNLYKKNVSKIINDSNEKRNAAVTERTVTLSRRTHIFSPNTQTDRQTDEGEEASEVSRNRC